LLHSFIEVHMSRDHTKLRVFADAHQLTLHIYRNTKNFPKDEWFGMRYIALGSACELKYLAGLATELELITKGVGHELLKRADAVVRQLERLVESMEDALAVERERKNQDRRR
jgi:hypothetical protein